MSTLYFWVLNSTSILYACRLRGFFFLLRLLLFLQAFHMVVVRVCTLCCVLNDALCNSVYKYHFRLFELWQTMMTMRCCALCVWFKAFACAKELVVLYDFIKIHIFTRAFVIFEYTFNVFFLTSCNNTRNFQK